MSQETLKTLQGMQTIEADVTNHSDIQKIYKETGGVDILFNGVGIVHGGTILESDEKQWDQAFNVNVKSMFQIIKLYLPYMIEQKSGSIINAAIGGGKSPNAAQLPTSVTRAAGINLTKSLSNEYAPYNIRVNAICIGLIKSAQWERKAHNSNVETLYKELAKKVPMGKVGEEIDFANLVAFLSSNRSSFITGAAINLDGGMCPVV